jgi:hypothetical protein
MKKDELKEFQEHCDFWITALSLTDWDYRVALRVLKKDNANVLLNPEGRKAYISLGKKREEHITIEQLAIHECSEILLADLAFLLQKYYSDELTEQEIHKVINRLMPIFLGFRK